MDFKLLNNITGWAIFLIAAVVFTISVEPTTSFWDCGEFIAVSYKLMVPHPPGAPLYLLVGRMFSLFASDVTQVAFWVNMVSALSSAFTVLFLFWAITLLGLKIRRVSNETATMADTVAILGSGAIGGLAFTFSDTFWFSAAEAEVYAMSVFFTAFVFWAILRWERIEDESEANRWMILIAYMVGLSIGVHLLNLVAIPALGIVYYFKRHRLSTKGVIIALGISAAIVLTILSGIIPGLPSLAGSFEIFFVNSLGLPFGSGVIFFVAAFLGALIYSILWSIKKQKVLLNTALLCLTFILIGYASYGLVLVRSDFDPPIDENDPENIIRFVSYLKREQYGDRPLLYGPTFKAEVVDYKKGADLYMKGEDKYEVFDTKTIQVWDKKNQMLLPRAYDKRPDRVDAYYSWMGIRKDDRITMGDNLAFLFKYQLGHMYWRYFMWNFSGRESDTQGASWLLPWDAFVDVTEEMAHNQARNNYFMLPLILGLLGAFYHFKTHKLDASVVALLFFFTGIAIILYLNQPPNEPRERDYTSVGSFYAFCIWIGIGVMAVADFLGRVIRPAMMRNSIAIVLCLVVPGVMAAEGWDDHDRSGRYFARDSAKNILNSCAENAILFTGGDNDTFPLWYVQNVEGFRDDVRVVVLSYLTADWYIKQMKDQSYASDPLPISLEYNNFIQGTNDYLPVSPNPKVAGGVNIKQLMKLIKENHPAIQVRFGTGSMSNSLPSKTFLLPIDKQKVIDMGIIPKNQEANVVDQMSWTLNGNYIYKNDLIILDILAHNDWERPVYFNNTSLSTSQLNLRDYVQTEGFTYRVLPIKQPSTQRGRERVQTDIMYDNMMNNTFWTNTDDESVYFDDENKKFVINSRNTFAILAVALINEGKREKARNVIQKCFEVLPDGPALYDVTTPQFVDLMLKAEMNEKADEVANVLARRAEENLNFIRKHGEAGERDTQQNLYVLNTLSSAYQANGQKEKAAKYRELLDANMSMFQ